MVLAAFQSPGIQVIGEILKPLFTSIGLLQPPNNPLSGVSGNIPQDGSGAIRTLHICQDAPESAAQPPSGCQYAHQR